MINGQPVTAFIPVRGGSKGIPGKNLRRLGKDTLLERAIKQARSSPFVDKVIVSTDDTEMYRIAQNYDVATPALRPDYLASDDAKTIDVILYTLEEMEVDNGYILLLQTTSPLRTVEDINRLCDTFEKKIDDAQAIVSVSEIGSSHPDKMQKIQSGYLMSYLGKDSHVPRQSLPEVYELNGACYLTNIDILKSQKTFIPEKTIAFIMPIDRSVNLDTMFDWYLLEKLIEEKVVSVEEYGN
jgi:CMP-N-acetylneuraminic acid synthetase